MSVWTLSDIRNKVRQVTGRFSDSDLSNNDLDDYINKYYTLTFPAEVKLDKKNVFYEFLTVENQATYDKPDTLFTNFIPPVTINNLDISWYQNPSDFEKNNPLSYKFAKPWAGNGVETSFSTILVGTPMFPGKLTISDGVEVFEDTNKDWTFSDILIEGSLGGSATVNYQSGTVVVTFFSPPANGKNINLNHVSFKPGRPDAVLMYDNKFQFFPVPDQSYKIKMNAYAATKELVEVTDTPELDQWGPMIAYGTAKDIFSDKGELDSYAETNQLYREQKNYVLAKTCQNLLNTRAKPEF